MKFDPRGWGAPWSMRQPFKNGPWMVETSTRTVVTGIGTHGEAKIIAAAPEAIAELERVTDLLDTWAKDHPTERTAEIDAALHCARAVLAKAIP